MSIGIQLTALADKAGNRRLLERVCIPFLDGLPTEKHPVRCHQNGVLRKKRGHGAGVILVRVPAARVQKEPFSFRGFA